MKFNAKREAELLELENYSRRLSLHVSRNVLSYHSEYSSDRSVHWLDRISRHGSFASLFFFQFNSGAIPARVKFLPLVRFQSEELKAEPSSYLLQTGIHPRDCILSVRFDLHYLDLCTSLIESLSRDATGLYCNLELTN